MESENFQQFQELTSPPSAHNETLMAPPLLFESIMSRIEPLGPLVSGQAPADDVLFSLHDPRWEVRMAVVYALSKQDIQPAQALIVEALQDEHHMVRATAVRALARLDLRVALENLILVLKDKDWQVREIAVFVLEELMPVSASMIQPLLQIAAQDHNLAVQSAANKALERLTFLPELVPEHQHEEMPLAMQQMSAPHSLWNHLQHWKLVLRAQLALPMVRQFCLFGTLGLILGYGLTFFSITRDFPTTANNLTWLCLLFTAAGIAFIIDPRQDQGLETALATPTSLRIIQLSRFTIVVGLQLLLAMGGSLLITLIYHIQFIAVLQLWFIPLLAPIAFVATLILALVLIIKSWIVCLVIGILPFWQSPDNQWSLLSVPPILLLLLSCLCLVFAFFYLPHQARTLVRPL